jgi:phenylacetate-CoA ligase
VPEGRLRVLQIAPSTRMTGGNAVQAELLRTGLRERGLVVDLLPLDLPLPWPLARVRGLRTLVRWPIFCLLLVLRARRYHVLHVFSAAYDSFLLWTVPAVVLGRLLGRRTVLNYRSGEARDHLVRQGWLAKPVMRLASVLVVPSGYLQDIFAEHGLAAQAVFNVVDLKAFQYRERDFARPVMLVPRTLEALYNVGAALEAFKVVKAACPGAELLITGEGPERPALERKVAEEGIKGVTFLGRVPHAQMPAIYDRADILLNPTNVDNMPVSLLEAFASGLPVVSTDAGGIPYLVTSGENGLLAPVGDSAGLAAHLLWVISHPDEARALARKAWEEREQYTWERVAERWLEVYRGGS